MSHQSNNIFQTIKTYWFLVIVVVGIIVGWANLQTSDASQNGRLDKLEITQNKSLEIQQQNQVQLTQIQTDLQWIKSKLSNK